jgi:hypothetical protein
VSNVVAAKDAATGIHHNEAVLAVE